MSELLPVRALGLSEDETDALSELLDVWSRKRAKNLLLSVYYDSKQAFQDLGISLPPQMRNVKAALGWPAKGVRALARKHVFEGFSLAGEPDAFDLNEMLERNRFDLELPQAISSAYKHSCSFITTTRGDTSAGEPEVMIQARDAEWSAAVWDRRRREIRHALAITDVDERTQPTEAVLFMRHATLQLTRTFGVWRAHHLPNRTGRVLVEPLVYDPQLSRPFGRSRITREVRYLTDSAIRTLLRTETSAEFYSSPQRYALGVKEEAFKDSGRWQAILGRLLALELNEEGEKPTVGQFPQMTMSPHLEHYRQLAQNFCSETGLPMSMVGIFADNPASAEAQQAAEAALAEEAEYQWRVFRPSLLRVQQNALMLRDSLTEPPAESWKSQVNWTPARYVSPQASSDYVVKAVGADPQLAGTSVMRRRLGMTQAEIEEVEAEIRRRSSPGLLAQVLEARGSTAGGERVDGQRDPKETADARLSQINVYRVATQSGAEQASAARYAAGEIPITALAFREGYEPVTLRRTESE